MPDERQDSIRRGIHAPEESPTGAAAERERRARVAQDPPMESAMGGTSDASRAAEDAQLNAARAAEATVAQPDGSPGEATDDESAAPSVVEESREASLRSRGGGSADEEEIADAARNERV